MIVDKSSDQIGREQIGSELNSLEFRLNCPGESFYGHRFREAGDSFEKNVSVGKQADEQSLNHIFLSNNNFPDFHREQVNKRTFALNLLVDSFNIVLHSTSEHE